MRLTTLLFAFLASGCAYGPGATSSTPIAAAIAPAASYDDVVAGTYERTSAAAEQAPGDERAALELADAAHVLLASNAATRGAASPSQVVARVEAVLSRVKPATPAARARLLLAAGRVQLAAKRADLAVREIEEAFELAPTASIGLALLDAHESKGAVERAVAIRVCERVRKTVSAPQERYAVVDGCLRRLDAASLPFEDREADLAFHAAESARQARAADDRARQRRRESERLRARMSTTP